MLGKIVGKAEDARGEYYIIEQSEAEINAWYEARGWMPPFVLIGSNKDDGDADEIDSDGA